MPRPLDQLLNELAAEGGEPRLDLLESRVWARIDVLRELAGRSLWGWRAAAAASMLMIGALTSGAAAVPVADTSPFAVRAALAPSTLLENGR